MEVRLDKEVDDDQQWITEDIQPRKKVRANVAHGIGYGKIARVLMANFSEEEEIIEANSELGSVNFSNLEIIGKEESVEKKKSLITSKCEVELNPKLSDLQRSQLSELIGGYNKVFGTSALGLGSFNEVNHHIPTGEAVPIKQRAYRLSTTNKNMVSEAIKEMMEAGIIEPSSSPWASPIVLVPKKDGGVRIVVDYRKLNAVTKKDCYPLPRIEEVHDTMGGHFWFTSVDFLSGYYQIPVALEDREKTAFITHDGLYQFKVTPFGLTSAPATFQRTIDTILNKVKWQFCMPYIDDIFIFSKNFEDHLQHIEIFLATILETGLKLKPEKCKFAFNQIKVLGHIINGTGIGVDPEKVAACKEMPKPKSVKEVQTFLGVVGYYRKFIENITELEEPLRKLTRKEEDFEFNEECVESFEKLKEALSSAPVLMHFNPTRHLYVKTDASGIGIGVVLTQLDENNEEHPVAYSSKKLNKHERNYTITERECLAMMHASKQFHTYLHSTAFTIITDHHALCYLKTMKNGDNKLARWALVLQQYNFEIVFKQGSKHTDADCFSRNPIDPFERSLKKYRSRAIMEGVEEDFEESPIKGFAFVVCMNIGYDKSIYERISEEQKKDKYCKEWMEKVFQDPEEDNFVIHDGILFRRVKYKDKPIRETVVVPTKLRKYVLADFHDATIAGHLGASKTYGKIGQRFWWKNIKGDITKFVKSCQVCQDRNTPKNKKQGFLRPSEAKFPWEVVSIDILGPLKETGNGNSYVIACQDHFTKFIELDGMPDTTAESVANFILYRIILIHGAPGTMLSDRGKQFVAKFVKQLYDLLLIKRALCSPYRPQTNGQVERLNSSIVSMMAKYTNRHHTDWDDYLPFIQFAYNTSPQDTTRYSPFYVDHGREANFPSDIYFDNKPELEVDDYVAEVEKRMVEVRKIVNENISKRQEREKKDYNRNKTEVKFKIGDLVSIKRMIPEIGKSQKLISRWKKKGEIVEMATSGLAAGVKHLDDGEIKFYSLKNLKPYFIPIEDIDEEEVQLISRVVIEEVSEEVSQEENVDGNLLVDHRDASSDIGNDEDLEQDVQSVEETPKELPKPRRSGRHRRRPKKLEDYVQ